MSISDINGEVDGYKFKVLGYRSTEDSVGIVKRIILMVRLKKSYVTYCGTTKYWHPFYISSGTFGGTARGDVAPFSGVILSKGKCKSFFSKIIRPLGVIEDYERIHLKQITSNCVSYMVKCNPNQLINLCKNYLIDVFSGQVYSSTINDNEDTLTLHLSTLYEILTIKNINYKEITPAFKKDNRSEIKQLINNSIKFNLRFPQEKDYSPKICNKEFNEIKNILRSYFMDAEGVLLIKTLPEITDKDINSQIGNNNMFGINLSNVKKIAFDYRVWDKYKKTILSKYPIIDDINHYACMNDILLSILKKIGNISRKNLHIDSSSLEDWDNLLDKQIKTNPNRKKTNVFSENSPSSGKSQSHNSSKRSGKSQSNNSPKNSGKSRSHNSSKRSGKSESHNSSKKSGKSDLVINDPLGIGISLREALFSNSKNFLSSPRTPHKKYKPNQLWGSKTKGKHRKLSDRYIKRKRKTKRKRKKK